MDYYAENFSHLYLLDDQELTLCFPKLSRYTKTDCLIYLSLSVWTIHLGYIDNLYNRNVNLLFMLLDLFYINNLARDRVIIKNISPVWGDDFNILFFKSKMDNSDRDVVFILEDKEYNL